MVKKSKSDNVDEKKDASFRAAVRGVKPLLSTKIPIRPPSLPPRPKPAKNQDPESVFVFSDFENLPLVDSNDLLFYAKSGAQDKILRNLRGGHYNIEAILDLHGKTVTEARDALGLFILQCQRKKLRHLLIIHGKGRGKNKPILKNKLNHWLRQTDDIIAFCSATPKYGQQGALFVLLRRVLLGK
jgi:DNA-nicking Smr family endonuclease